MIPRKEGGKDSNDRYRGRKDTKEGIKRGRIPRKKRHQ
jgi:hypothetical protein